MHQIGLKILVLIPVLLLIAILFYKKINENFDSIIPTTTSTPTLSLQIVQGISIKLGISVRRITNLVFTGDIATQNLSVSFRILDPNLIEIGNREPDAKTVIDNANALFSSNQFNIFINGSNIMLNKMNPNNQSSTNQRQIYADFFDNKSLLSVANYANRKYNAVPNESSYTNFYVLQPDSNFNLQPVLP
jgi:hypothetical protein